MAVVDWPIEFGYAEFSEMPHRSRGPYVQRSVYTGAVHVSYGGGRRRRGYVVTPVSTANGAVQPEITELVQRLSDPANQLRLAFPAAGVVGSDPLIVQVTRIQPPERDERGVWRGWRLEFAETAETAEPPAPIVQFALASASANEGETATAMVMSDQDAPPGGLVIGYTVGGTATSGTDYTALSGTATIAAGQRTADIPVVVTDDAETEPAETVILTLSASDDYEIGTAGVWTLTIGASDIPPTVQFTAASASANEGETATAMVMSDQDASAGGLTVEYTVGGTATSGTDYTALSGTVTIAEGQRSASIAVVVADDSAVEDAEAVILTLSAGAGYTVGARDVWTLTIPGFVLPSFTLPADSYDRALRVSGWRNDSGLGLVLPASAWEDDLIGLVVRLAIVRSDGVGGPLQAAAGELLIGFNSTRILRDDWLDDYALTLSAAGHTVVISNTVRRAGSGLVTYYRPADSDLQDALLALVNSLESATDKSGTVSVTVVGV